MFGTRSSTRTRPREYAAEETYDGGEKEEGKVAGGAAPVTATISYSVSPRGRPSLEAVLGPGITGRISLALTCAL